MKNIREIERTSLGLIFIRENNIYKRDLILPSKNEWALLNIGATPVHNESCSIPEGTRQVLVI